MTQMLGSRWARQAVDRGEDPHVIWQRWERQLEEWSAVRARYALYPSWPATPRSLPEGSG
jgi:hypothetical protein